MRDHDVTTLTARELDRARRQLAASLALARPESPTRAPILARIGAIDAELAGRAPRGQRGISLCSCGFGTDDPSWLDGHLFEHPAHYALPHAPTWKMHRDLRRNSQTYRGAQTETAESSKN
jgi:hypothetical protein